ncbi:MAG: TonB-dependent receptor [Thermoanaerobaculia bacterium]
MPILADATNTGFVTGVVVSTDGGPLPGVMVQLQGDRGKKSTVTDANGAFRFMDLPPGNYKVRAELSGFQPAERATAVTAGVRSNLELKLGQALTAEVTVSGEEIPLISQYDTSVGSTLPAQVVEKVTFDTFGDRSVIASMPGVVNSPDSQDTANASPLVNGGEPQENGSFVDGVDTTDPGTGGVSHINFPTSALEEIRQDGSGYGAEYGRTVSGVNSVVTKSGTNDFHGMFSYQAQNPSWRAESEHVPVDRPNEIQSTFDASLGGPIVRDKAWFFASASKGNTNQITALQSGDVIDSSAKLHTEMLKLNFKPGAAHALALTVINSPVDLDLTASYGYDKYTVPNYSTKGQLYTGTWSWTVSDKLFLELRAAHENFGIDVTQSRFPEVVPGANPDGPAGNQSWYYDIAGGFIHHAPFYGPRQTKFPRDQANLGFTWFAGSHELKVGIDYQNFDYQRLNGPTPDQYIGLYYNDALPLGFVVPVLKNVFVPATEWVTTTTTAEAFYVQDRFSLGRLTLNLGLRYDYQKHTEKGGGTLESSGDLAPRLAAIYDAKGDGTLLLKATANRYYTLINQNMLVPAVKANDGTNVYDQYAWIAAYGIYYPIGRQDATKAKIENLNPYFKDEYTLGFDWQFHPKWALSARGIYWKVKDMNAVQQQFDESGNVYSLIYSVPGTKREYKGLQIELNRRFTNGWMLGTNYTLSRIEGNCFPVSGATTCAYNVASAITDPATGQPVTTANSYGPAFYDSTHILNVLGAKSWQLGKHNLNLGGYFQYRSGARWQMTQGVVLTSPISGQQIQTTLYTEPKGSRSLPSYYTLSLNGEWKFPIAGQLQGGLRVEAANVTNQQTQINVNEMTGQPPNIASSYLKPREFRFSASLSF